jgi:hypothetical protein
VPTGGDSGGFRCSPNLQYRGRPDPRLTAPSDRRSSNGTVPFYARANRESGVQGLDRPPVRDASVARAAKEAAQSQDGEDEQRQEVQGGVVPVAHVGDDDRHGPVIGGQGRILQRAPERPRALPTGRALVGLLRVGAGQRVTWNRAVRALPSCLRLVPGVTSST